MLYTSIKKLAIYSYTYSANKLWLNSAVKLDIFFAVYLQFFDKCGLLPISKGNRTLYGDVIAGPMYIVGEDTDGGFCGLTEGQASAVNVPLIEESPVNIECRVTQVIPLGSHDMFLAEIVAVDIDGELIDSSGKLHLERAGLAAFAHGDYYALGKKLAPFGCSVKAKNKTKKAHCH
ncbi:MAG: hypothetical protein BHW37_04180 [Firmicutes bacterium CAG:272_52_7]|nr:MAG: hypothetical protein BHW37_04180 [Firmicutes bacterium CAG:272_52_7]